MSTPLDILKKYWKFSSFRHPQEEIINSVLADNDTIALLPTGGGKSVCFQVPAILKKGVCIVISPLIALMQDQVASLQEKGIKATSIASGSSQDDIIRLFDNVQFGGYQFLYLSPERLQSKFIQQKIAQLKVSLIAIDEAHCISEWGHDFRPSYRNIAVLKEIHPEVNIIALTASATQKVLDDITEYLQLNEPNIFRKSFYRDNLAYRIVKTEDKLQKIKLTFTKIKESGIIYVNSRNKTKEISRYLQANGFTASYYHGGLSSIEKELHYKDWISNKSQIMVATNAFGMGIDKPDVRVVIHYNLPNSIENYVQEAGRAGRDGKRAFSVVLCNSSDISLTIDLFKKSLPKIDDIKKIHKKLYQNFQIAKGELVETGFEFQFLNFCNKYDFIPSKVYHSLRILENFGIIQLNTNFQQKSTIRFLVNSPQIFKYTNGNSQKEQFIRVLMRMYGGLFENNITIDEFYLARKTASTSWTVISRLEKLANENLIEYNKSSKNDELFFLQPREDNKTINRVSKDIKAYLKRKRKKTKKLIKFIENNEVCRSIQLLSYFGEESTLNCGVCDVCKAKNNTIKLDTAVILTLLHKQPLTTQEICKQLNTSENEVLVHLRSLLSEEKIGITVDNHYYSKESSDFT